METHAHLAAFVGWPDNGALMRRLDDGRHTKDGKPGNMYEHLWADEQERQHNLALFKAWVGEGGWFLGKFKGLNTATLTRKRRAAPSFLDPLGGPDAKRQVWGRSQVNEGPPRVDSTPSGGELGAGRPWGRSGRGRQRNSPMPEV
jgi:hypothetical protein